ncbi:reverse transcriptase domain-containing protein [Lactobacillus sp. ESL0791]|uniref:reverse transcriptase domain-containing protein n=1 Tax=Lactobacillus sp. ESL0791 TaxID=2983234 RepID=UPI0023F94B30|nr:reverse transcriptase domain-containing protein [Lactobacillus sp. ESL0791]
MFSDNSYGFRPDRRAQDAVRKWSNNYNQGYHYVVSLDLKAYFDNVNHDLLMKFLEQHVYDEWILHLVQKFLISGVMNGQIL